MSAQNFETSRDVFKRFADVSELSRVFSSPRRLVRRLRDVSRDVSQDVSRDVSQDISEAPPVCRRPLVGVDVASEMSVPFSCWRCDQCQRAFSSSQALGSQRGRDGKGGVYKRVRCTACDAEVVACTVDRWRRCAACRPAEHPTTTTIMTTATATTTTTASGGGGSGVDDAVCRSTTPDEDGCRRHHQRHVQVWRFVDA